MATCRHTEIDAHFRREHGSCGMHIKLLSYARCNWHKYINAQYTHVYILVIRTIPAGHSQLQLLDDVYDYSFNI